MLSKQAIFRLAHTKSSLDQPCLKQTGRVSGSGQITSISPAQVPPAPLPCALQQILCGTSGGSELAAQPGWLPAPPLVLPCRLLGFAALRAAQGQSFCQLPDLTGLEALVQLIEKSGSNGRFERRDTAQGPSQLSVSTAASHPVPAQMQWKDAPGKMDSAILSEQTPVLQLWLPWQRGCYDKMCVETRERERKDSDLESWGWESTKGRDNEQVLLHRTAQRCAASPVCDTENDSRAEVFPDPPVMEICLVPLRRLSFAKAGKHDPRWISTRVFLHCFEQSCDNHLCEHPLWHWPCQTS